MGTHSHETQCSIEKKLKRVQALKTLAVLTLHVVILSSNSYKNKHSATNKLPLLKGTSLLTPFKVTCLAPFLLYQDVKLQARRLGETEKSMRIQ